MRRGGGGTYVPRERLYKLARRADVPGRRCGERPPGGAATAGRTAATVGRTTVATAGADDGDGARGTPWRAADVDAATAPSRARCAGPWGCRRCRPRPS